MIVKDIGVGAAEGYIELWLINLNESLNLKRPMKETQISECSFLIVSEYLNITIADINIIFNNAKKGEYGEFFESLSMHKVLSWFREYFDERCNTSGEMVRENHEKLKYNEERSERASERDAKAFGSFLHQYNKEKLTQSINESKKRK